MSTEMTKREADVPEPVAAQPTVSPLVDVYENEAEWLIVADIPGVEEDLLTLDVHDEQLTIAGKRVAYSHGAPLGPQETHTADFRRVFQLPAVVDATQITAKLKRGVLKVQLPKAAAAKPTRIPVTAEQ